MLIGAVLVTVAQKVDELNKRNQRLEQENKALKEDVQDLRDKRRN